MPDHKRDPEALGRDRPTLDTVAHAAGVSRMTVSNAYNRPDQLSEETRARVLRLAAELGYGGPDPAGRSLRRGRSGTVGVVLTDHLAKAFGDPGMVAFLHGVATTLGGAGQALLLLPVAESVPERRQLVNDAAVDGFVLVGVPTGSPVVEDVLARRLPVVTAGSLRLERTPNVGVDDAAASRVLAEHLLGLGHRRFGIVTVVPAVVTAAGPAAPPVAIPAARAGAATRHGGFRRRVEGYLAAFAAAGVPTEAVGVAGVATNDRAGGAAAGALLLAADASPTAVLCVTDILALGVLDAVADLGLDVPGQVSVAGFDGIEEAVRTRPALTTVRQDLFGQGQIAAELLLARLAGRTPRSVRRQTELAVGGTTGRAPTRT